MRLPLTGVLVWALAANSWLHAQTFTDVTDELGLTMEHSMNLQIVSDDDLLGCFGCEVEPVPPGYPDDAHALCPDSEVISTWFNCGVAAGDLDGDLFPELFVIGGDAGSSRLFKRIEDGSYLDVAADWGVQITGEKASGVVFADYDGDYDLDIFVGGLIDTRPRLYRNDGGQPPQFTDVFDSAFPGYTYPNTLGAAFGDYDLDGDLDAYLPHSMSPRGPLLDDGLQPECLPFGALNSTQHLWRNNGDGTFSDATIETGIAELYGPAGLFQTDQTFSPNFEDIDMDGDLDLIVASDIGTSVVLVNDLPNGRFIETGEDIRGHSSMGTGVGDYDNDGDFDWFVSQIDDGPSQDGNRLWQNDGQGNFTDRAVDAGVADGWWGWASSFGDLDHNGWLDIFHVNGFTWDFDGQPEAYYCDRPALAFMSNGDGETFTELAETLGLADTGNGRGCALVDFDLDGDLDVAISNHNGPFKLYRNDLNDQRFLELKLVGLAPNTEGIGAQVRVASDQPGEQGELLRGVRAGCNYQSANPNVAHFGLGNYSGPFTATVLWPGGHESATSGLQPGTLWFVQELAKIALENESTVFPGSDPATIQATALGPDGVDLSAQLRWWREGEGVLDVVGPTFTQPAGTLEPGRYTMAAFLGSTSVTFRRFELVIQ